MKIVIVGGGPAGMLAAIAASKENSNRDIHSKNEVFLIEKNEKLGKKLFITGKGRCNVTNFCDNEEFFRSVITNSRFLFSAFNEFSNKDLYNLLKDNGCPLKVERGNRVFPVSDKSYDITDTLRRILVKQGVKIELNKNLFKINIKNDSEKIVNDKNKVFKIESILIEDLKTKNKEKIDIDKLVIATGGLSYSSTGSTGDGYKFAKSLDINVIKQSPSLVPLIVEESEECRKMNRLLLKNIGIKVFEKENKKKIYEDFGEMEFINDYISGPIILSTSCYIEDEKKYILKLDLKPALDEKKLNDRIIRDIENNKNGNLIELIRGLLPKIMVNIFIDRLFKNIDIDYDKIDRKEEVCLNYKNSEITKELRTKIIKLLKDFEYTIIGKRGFEEAIITRGGVDVKEINPKTMECKKIKGIYFAGEVLDIDCMTGGFNIQVAATTGYVAGLYATNGC